MIEPLLGLPVGGPRFSLHMTPEERRERERARSAQYRHRYPNRSRAADRASKANAQAVHFGLPGRIYAADVIDLWNRHPVCVWCGVGRGVDHIVAMTDGGPNDPSNIQNLCEPCNRRKGSIRNGRFVRLTHCRRGHELTPENTYTSGPGRRRCGPCDLRRQLARRRAQGIGPRLSETCHAGHPWTPESTDVKSNGRRQCAICRRVWQRQHRQSPTAGDQTRSRAG